MINDTLLNERIQKRNTQPDADPEALATIVSMSREWLEAEDYVNVVRLNPYLIAARSGLDRERVVAEFLHGTRTGLFDLYWDVHCPHCDGISAETNALKKTGGLAHCAICEVEYDVDFLVRVEASFAYPLDILNIPLPAMCAMPASLRPRPLIGGVAPGERDAVKADVTEGEYRIICPITSSVGILRVSGASAKETQELNIIQLDGRFKERMYSVAPGKVRFVVENRGQTPSGLIMSDRDPGPELQARDLPDRLSGLGLMHHPVFKKVFGDESLSDRERLRIASVSILFTDITGSTRLYEELGDARAYNIVRDHFDILFQAIVDCGGTVIKTIGDSVMASFVSSEQAVLASFAVSRGLRDYNERRPESNPLEIRMGIHSGPAVLVNLNDRLDYFGTTVNKAARIEELSGAGEIAISDTVLTETRGALSALGVHSIRRKRATIAGLRGEHQVFVLGAVKDATSAGQKGHAA